MVVVQVFQANLLNTLDMSDLSSDAFKELCIATGQVLHSTNATTQAIGKAMAKLVVLERYLLLNLIKIKDSLAGGTIQIGRLNQGVDMLSWDNVAQGE